MAKVFIKINSYYSYYCIYFLSSVTMRLRLMLCTVRINLYTLLFKYFCFFFFSIQNSAPSWNSHHRLYRYKLYSFSIIASYWEKLFPNNENAEKLMLLATRIRFNRTCIIPRVLLSPRHGPFMSSSIFDTYF